MSQHATPATTVVTLVVRFWCEWSQGQPRWRGRVEHVASGQQANFLAIEDLLRFWQRFTIGMPAPTDSGDATGTPRAAARGGE